ncbi:G5 domain-containing protein [Fredinandcohnia sp. QZ13]|uniref:G5 domain-containing protein n=1 Tax=Fredinandcohnia sp. QZ13 TaxID=3073144 RepID=UPI0028535240|nr:G5 domain-containing protein [Fredinandcohnia sp. QZ13]MDR4889119.1 G5 domain-containing protein [Fredinandcohnia sp. QZ13]
MQKLHTVKIFSLLLLCVLLLSLFSTFGTKTYHAFFSGDSFKEGTMIGPVDVSGLSEENARAALLSEIETWYGMGDITLVSGDMKNAVNKREMFSFDILESVNTAVHGTQNPLLTGVKDETLEKVLNEFSSKDINTVELENEMLLLASTLHPGAIEINLVQFGKVDEKNVVSQTVIRNLNDESEIVKWVKEFGVIHLPANKPFSLLSFLSESGTTSTFSNEALSVIATGIYSSVLSTNFEIVERHISAQLPYYATFGNEAMIEKEIKDLMIYNVNPFEYRLLFSLKDREFTVQLIGPEMQSSIHVKIEDEESLEPKIIKQYDSTLPKGEMVVKQKGTAGQFGKIYRIIQKVGEVDEKVKVAEDYYPPVHTIEVHSILFPEPPQPEKDVTDLDGNPETNNGSNREENNQGSGNETDEDIEKEKIDLWEDPDPLHLQKS